MTDSRQQTDRARRAIRGRLDADELQSACTVRCAHSTIPTSIECFAFRSALAALSGRLAAAAAAATASPLLIDHDRERKRKSELPAGLKPDWGVGAWVET